MKIALIQPVQETLPPLALLSLIACLDGSHETVLIDLNLEGDHKLLGAHYDLAGIACTAYDIDDTLKISAGLKKLGAKIVVGGIHPTLDPSSMLKSENIDFVIRGAGDRSFPSLVEALEKDLSYEGIDGLCYKKNSGQVISGIAGISDLDSLPVPAYGKYIEKDYPSPVNEYISYESARGCVNRCRYCSLWKTTESNMFFKTKSKVLSDLRALVKTVDPVRRVHFVDSFVNPTKERLSDICDVMIELNTEYKNPVDWTALFKTRNFDDALIAKMRESNNARASIGFETANQRSLDLLRRGESAEENIRIIEKLNDAGINVYTGFQMGLPWETKEEMWHSAKVAVELLKKGVSTKLLMHMPLPGTDMESPDVYEDMPSSVKFSITGDLGFKHPEVSNEEIREIFAYYEDNLCYIKDLSRLDF